jgi:hypothetical protein
MSRNKGMRIHKNNLHERNLAPGLETHITTEGGGNYIIPNHPEGNTSKEIGRRISFEMGRGMMDKPADIKFNQKPK